MKMRVGPTIAATLISLAVSLPSQAMVENSKAAAGTCIAFKNGSSEIDENSSSALEGLIDKVRNRSPFDGIHILFSRVFSIGDGNRLETERVKKVLAFIHDRAPELLVNNVAVMGNATLVTYKCEAEINFFYKTVCDSVTDQCSVKED